MGKDPNAVSLGRLGGIARAKSLSSNRKAAIATLGAQTRWGTKSPPPKKPSPAIQEAQWKLDSAVVRGEPNEVLEVLRLELAALQKEK